MSGLLEEWRWMPWAENPWPSRDSHVERLTQTLQPSSVCRSCDGRGFNGFMGHPIVCSRCNGTKLDPNPSEPLEIVTGWVLRIGAAADQKPGEGHDHG